MKMKLNKALKLKNKLVEEINKAFIYLENNNSLDEGTPRAYSVKAKLEEAISKTNELVELKAKIHMANSPVWDKIFMLSELKGTVSKLKRMNTREKAASTYSEAVVAEIGLLEKDELVKGLEQRIEEIQEELDIHNHATMID